MFEWLFGKKKGVEELKDETKRGFSAVKNDINSLSEWVKHLNKQDDLHKQAVDDVNVRLSSMETDLEGIKNMLALMDGKYSKRLFKQRERKFVEQTAVQGVYDGVQTAVQTAETYSNLSIHNLSSMERAIVVILLNTDMKLSYDDLASMTGKSRATVRGQINSIKRKSESLIEEIIERNGKKRVFIPEETKEKLLKSVKVRVSKPGKHGKKFKVEEF